MVRMFVLAALLTTGSALASQAGDDFFYSPVPRWSSEPPSEALCAAMRRECPAILPRTGNVSRDVAYDELYDAAGHLRGLRVTQSTGCRPLDEETAVSMRRFIRDMHEHGPDLPDYRIETPAGISAEGMRIVHHNHTTNIVGCTRG